MGQLMVVSWTELHEARLLLHGLVTTPHVLPPGLRPRAYQILSAMDRNPVIVAGRVDVRESALATNKVLRNTYLLLSATLAFSALAAGTSFTLDLPYLGPWVTLIGYFALLFAVHKTADSA